MKADHIFNRIPEESLEDLQAIISHAMDCKCFDAHRINPRNRVRYSKRNLARKKAIEARNFNRVAGLYPRGGALVEPAKVRAKKPTSSFHALANLKRKAAKKDWERLTRPQARILLAALQAVYYCPGFDARFDWSPGLLSRKNRDVPPPERIQYLIEQVSNWSPPSAQLGTVKG